MKTPGFHCCLLFATMCWSGSLFAQEASLKLDVTFKNADNDVPSSVETSLEIVTAKTTGCFFLPFNDPNYRTYSNLQERVDFQQLGGSRLAPFGGETKILESNVALKQITPALFKFTTAADTAIHIKSRSSIPRYLADEPTQWFYYDFHPILLRECPSAAEEPQDYVRNAPLSIEARIHAPKDWQLVAAEAKNVGANVWEVKQRNSEFTFALLRSVRYSHFTAGALPVKIYYTDENFLRLVPTIRESLNLLENWCGSYPLRDLIIIESLHLERENLAGLILINKPKQESFHSVQIDWLNWAHWTMVNQLASQWWGGFIFPERAKDQWLTAGMAEFLTLVVTSSTEARFDLFNLFEDAINLLDMNYRQLQDLGAAVLFQDDPDAILTDKSLKTYDPIEKQHAMLPIRMAIALRHLNGLWGSSGLRDVTRTLTQQFLFRSLTPRIYFDSLKQSSIGSTERQRDLEEFRQWWVKPGWPDAKLEDFETSQTKEGKWRTTITASQNENFPVSFRITTTEVSGVKETKLASPPRPTFKQTFVTEHKPKMVTLDEDRWIFDSNRYNNSSEWPSVKFFPGSARGIPDDGYIIVWFPYPLRRPGQPWSMALQLGLLRYIASSTTLKIEHELSEKERASFEFQQTYEAPEYRLSGAVSARQNIYGSRLAEIVTSYGPIFSQGPRIGAGLFLRHRQVVGQSESQHGTMAPAIDIRPFGRSRFLGYHIFGEYEIAPEQSQDFSYERRFAVAETYLFLRNIFDYTLRLFRGSIITNSGSVPNEFYFHPLDAREARLRLDASDLSRSSDLFSIGNDFYLPFLLPVRDTGIIVTNKLKWRLFYDYGQSFTPRVTFKDAGVGIDAPLGGDVMGVGSMALTKMSLLAVLFSDVNGETSKKPRILFNIGSEF